MNEEGAGVTRVRGDNKMQRDVYGTALQRAGRSGREGMRLGMIDV